MRLHGGPKREPFGDLQHRDGPWGTMEKVRF